MKKSELKQIIKECIKEISSDTQGMNEESSIDLDVSKIEDIEVDGVNRRDYPDFADAYVVRAVYPIVSKPVKPSDWRYLTKDELDWLNDTHPEIAQEKARSLYS